MYCAQARLMSVHWTGGLRPQRRSGNAGPAPVGWADWASRGRLSGWQQIVQEKQHASVEQWRNSQQTKPLTALRSRSFEHRADIDVGKANAQNHQPQIITASDEVTNKARSLAGSSRSEDQRRRMNVAQRTIPAAM